jgi:hypothetical protein
MASSLKAHRDRITRIQDKIEQQIGIIGEMRSIVGNIEKIINKRKGSPEMKNVKRVGLITQKLTFQWFG